MGAPRWEPEPDAVARLVRLTVSDAAREFGKAKETVRAWWARHPEHGEPPRGVSPRETEPEATPAGPPASVWQIPEHASFSNGMWAALEAVQAEMHALESEEFETEIALPDTGPVLVCWIADTHLGHTNCRMAKLRADLEAIKRTPGAYCLLGGDLMDNVVTSVASRGMHHQQLTPVRVQKQLVEEAVDYLGKENVLAMVLGNHDAWSIAQDDFDPIAYFAKRVGCPYLGPFGFVNLTLGVSRYRILAAHQFRMRSSFNLTHQAKRLEDFVGDADVVFTGHTHESSVESTYRRGAAKFYGQAGSYLQSSRYSKSLGFGEVTADMPAALLWPERKKVLGFHDGINDGIAFLSYLRGR